MIGICDIISVHVAITFVGEAVVCVVEINFAQGGGLLGDVACGVSRDSLGIP